MPKAIIVDHLTKEYTIGQLAHETMLREVLVNLVRRPFSRRLKKREKETIAALDKVSFAVETGEVVGVIGRNGAGKSTLLKILSRIVYPTSGKIEVRGRVASLLEVGTGFHDELTGRENIYLNGSILGMKKREIDSHLDEIIDFAGIDRFIDTPIKRYSSGMRLRLGFAVAAHLQTDILLVDEVLAVGDVEFQKKCLSKIQNLNEGGRTVLFVSHHMGAIEHLCPRTIWIDDGQVRQDGATEGVIRAYLAQFGGNRDTQANLRDIEEREGTGEIRFTEIEFLNSSGETVPVIRSNDPVTVRLHFHARSEVQGAQFGISLATDSGLKVATTGTTNAGLHFPLLAPGDGYVDASYQYLNLMPGRYWLSLWATGPNHYGKAKLCWDVLRYCVAIDIEPSDFYKSGTAGGRNAGLVLLPCKWKLGDVTEPANTMAGGYQRDRSGGHSTAPPASAGEP